jgi:recombination protein RecA
MANTKDIRTVLSNFEKDTMSNKGKPRIALYNEIERKFDVIPTGIPEVDAATRIGGLPRGKMVELFGPESGGKSWLSMKVAASAQKMGLRVAMLDIEHSFDPAWATNSTGLDANKLLYGGDFDNGEQALQYILGLCKDEVADVIILDSTAALLPKAEIEANLEDAQMGQMARMMSRACRQLSDAASKSNTLIIFVNQVREKIGVMFGNPETTPGGRALKFYSFMRIRVGKIGKLEVEKVQQGDDEIEVPYCQRSKLQVVKNKCAPPQGEAEFSIFFTNQFNTPMVRLVKKAYALGVLKRKTDDDSKKVFVWGKGKDMEYTGCEEATQMAEWVGSSLKVAELVQLTSAAATEKSETLEPELLALTDAPAEVS